ncbi:MAG: pyridoxamine 5'-phosphate oxidase family protein [Anaerolineaceae bacterium]
MHAVDWGTFELTVAPLAAVGRRRLHGRVAYLGTIRGDGAPRVHPVTPIVSDDALYTFMEPTSPKAKDLRRDPSFTLHAGVEDNNGGEGEFAFSGQAELVTDAAERQRAVAASSYVPAERYIVFALNVSEAVCTLYGEDGPSRTRWPSG